MSGKYVIGCGLSGLIFAFYNPDFEIISPDVGGKLQQDFMSSTILLYDTVETKMLLSDLGIESEAEAHIVRYYHDRQIIDSPPLEVIQTVARKKLTDWKSLPTLDLTVIVSEEHPPTASSFLPIFKIPSSKLVELLATHVKIINDKVKAITENEIITEKRKRLKYTEIVSTLAAPIFWQLYHEHRELRFLGLTFVNSETPPLLENIPEPWDLMYFPDANVPYTRVNRNPHTGSYLYEFSGEITQEELAQVCPDIQVKNYYFNKVGVIVTDLNNIPPRNIRFLGRFAEWDHHLQIQDTIREALANYDFSSVWNRQKSFQSNFYDFNVKDLGLRQRLTRDYVLLITDEAHDLLNAIHWKSGRYLDDVIERNQVLEEWIDVFKYWLSVGCIWGFSIDDFFHEFWRKSNEVEARYTKEDLERIRRSFR